MLDGTWSTISNDKACHLGAESFPQHQNVKMFLIHNPKIVMLVCLQFSNLRPQFRYCGEKLFGFFCTSKMFNHMFRIPIFTAPPEVDFGSCRSPAKDAS